MFNINFCQWLDSNRGPLELEETSLPTEPQPLSHILKMFIRPIYAFDIEWKRSSYYNEGHCSKIQSQSKF